MSISPRYFASPSDAGTVSRLRGSLGLAAEAEGLLDVAYTTVDSPVDTLLLAAALKGLVRVAFDIEDHDRVLETRSRRISPRVLRAPRRLDKAVRELEEYFGGKRRAFDLPLDLSLSTGCGLGRRYRLRDQPAAGRRALPPGTEGRRHARRLRRRSRREEGALVPGGSGMSDNE